MQYLVLLSALMSLATVVMAQDVETVVDDSGLDGPASGEPVSATAIGMDDMEEVMDW